MNGGRGIAIAVVASLIVGFAIGLVAGISFLRFGPRHFGPRHGRMEAFGPMGMGPGTRGGPRPLIGRLDRDLGLTKEQHDHILAALERLRAQHLALRDSTHAAIERELTPAQREKWRALVQHFQQSWRGRAGHPPDSLERPPGEGPAPGEPR